MTSVLDIYGPRFEALAAAYEQGSEEEFERQLDALLRDRERTMFLEIGNLTRDLNAALERFRLDSRLVDLAEKDVPDARARLEHVLRMTDAAAHHTLDLVEQSCPLAERIAHGAANITPLWAAFRERRIAVQDFRELLQRLDRFLDLSREDGETVRKNLSEVLLAQGYQDLSGQIIRSVMHLVGEVEDALRDLVRLSGGRRDTAPAPEPHDAFGADAHVGFGPPVPGVTRDTVVAGQQDVDALLSGLGV